MIWLGAQMPIRHLQPLPHRRSWDGDLPFGKLGDDLQPPAHRLTEAGDVHVRPLLQLGDGGLFTFDQQRGTIGKKPKPRGAVVTGQATDYLRPAIKVSATVRRRHGVHSFDQSLLPQSLQMLVVEVVGHRHVFLEPVVAGEYGGSPGVEGQLEAPACPMSEE